jgi:hypothetical protein
MDEEAVQRLIRDKVADGRLPHDGLTRISARPGHGETCVACEETVTPSQIVVENIGDNRHRPMQFHVLCFYLWTVERAVGRKSEQPDPLRRKDPRG